MQDRDSMRSAQGIKKNKTIKRECWTSTPMIGNNNIDSTPTAEKRWRFLNREMHSLLGKMKPNGP